MGDLIHVSIDEHLPADIVLIRSSDPQGCVFVETANLDGENNLKQKAVVAKCKQFCLVCSFKHDIVLLSSSQTISIHAIFISK